MADNRSVHPVCDAYQAKRGSVVNGVEFDPPNNGRIRATVNGAHCGDLDLLDDGFWQWFPVMLPGYIPSWVLRQIADKVDGLNAEWEAHLREALKCADMR